MEPVARKHHYNPRVLLAGFTPTGEGSDSLWDFDATLTRPYPRTPKGVGWELDYYTVDVPGLPPDAIEGYFGRIESTAAPVLRDLIATEKLPTGETYGNLMFFLALMYIRGPQWRQVLTSFPEAVAEMAFRMALSTPERWAAVEKAMRKAGLPERNVTYESMVRYAEKYGYGAKLANPGPVHTQQIVEALGWLPRDLGRRNWCLLAAEDDAEDFVSSDSPLTIVWTVPVPTLTRRAWLTRTPKSRWR